MKHSTLRRDGDSKDEAQRFQASQPVRELDVVSVWFTVEAKLKAGRIEEAKAIVAEYRASQRGN